MTGAMQAMRRPVGLLAIPARQKVQVTVHQQVDQIPCLLFVTAHKLFAKVISGTSIGKG
jgi:hypothetical protein